MERLNLRISKENSQKSEKEYITSNEDVTPGVKRNAKGEVHLVKP